MPEDDQEDKVLLQKIKLGEEKSFRKVYLKYHKQLYSVALKILRSEELAEDAVHDVYIKLWNNRKNLDASGSLRGFLFTSIKNHVFNIVNRQKRKLKKHIQLSYKKKMDRKESDNVVVFSKYREVYQSAIEQLPEKRREVFELKVKEGLTNREVAEYLEISINTVKSQYYKASKFIREFVEENTDMKTSGT